MKKVQNLSKDELARIETLIGEAFVTNELFHEFGSLTERRELVLKYMKYYVDCTYELGCLYQNEDGTGYIGISSPTKQKRMPKFKMLCKMLVAMPWGKMRRFLSHVSQIADSNKKYATFPHLDIMMVCIKNGYQGEGLARELVTFATDLSTEMKLPLLFDTDMKEYAAMYEHLGCRLYHQKTANNGVTRYNLVWLPK